MATITPITLTNNGAVSNQTINDNFENLNTDKIEADSLDTLTNKTIDGDDNTISDIATTSLKSKTGLDTNLVTGTQGVLDDIAIWNDDGDLISSSVIISTDGTFASDSDTKVPTEKATKTYVDSRPAFGSLCVQIAQASGGVNTFYTGGAPFAIYTLNGSGDYVMFNFILPLEATGVQSATIKASNMEGSTESFDYDIATAIGGSTDGQNWDQHTDGATSITSPIVGDEQIFAIDVTPYLSQATAGDQCLVGLTSSTVNDFGVESLVIEYTTA